MEHGRALSAGAIDAIEHQVMQVYVQIGGGAKALDEGGGAGVGCITFQPRLIKQKSRDDQDHYGYAMACIGDWALVCCGHSHQAEERKVATLKSDETWLVNPGTVAGLAAPGTWALGDLATMRAELRELGSQTGRSLTTSMGA
jgi:hypothetical protein